MPQASWRPRTHDTSSHSVDRVGRWGRAEPKTRPTKKAALESTVAGEERRPLEEGGCRSCRRVAFRRAEGRARQRRSPVKVVRWRPWFLSIVHSGLPYKTRDFPIPDFLVSLSLHPSPLTTLLSSRLHPRPFGTAAWGSVARLTLASLVFSGALHIFHDASLRITWSVGQPGLACLGRRRPSQVSFFSPQMSDLQVRG